MKNKKLKNKLLVSNNLSFVTMSNATNPFITKYELAAILAERAIEIANDQPITIKNPGTTNPIKIAQLEFEAGKLPKKIIREYPDGSTETWNLSDFQLL